MDSTGVVGKIQVNVVNKAEWTGGEEIEVYSNAFGGHYPTI
jgi:hypothetical protein